MFYSTDKRLGWDGETLSLIDDKNNIRYIDQKADILYLLTILKTFLSKKLRRNISFTAVHTQKIEEIIKNGEGDKEYIYINRDEYTTLEFSKIKQDSNVYLKITETERHRSLERNKFYYEFIKLGYKNFEILKPEFSLVISEFIAQYWVELLIRINIRF